MGLDASLAVPTAHEGLHTIWDQQHSLRQAGLGAHLAGGSPCPSNAMGGCWHAESLPPVPSLAGTRTWGTDFPCSNGNPSDALRRGGRGIRGKPLGTGLPQTPCPIPQWQVLGHQ